MPYTAEISRTNPTCFLFLVDQSSSMHEPFGAQPEKQKAEGVADAINRLMNNLVLKCAKSEGVRDFFHTGILGYGGAVGPVLGGALAGKPLVPVSELAANPLRIEQRQRKIDDGAGGLIEQSFKFPVWYAPRVGGRTPMTKALDLARVYVESFIRCYPACFPPMVIHITDGEATDGDPVPAAAALRELSTPDGNVLLFNAHVSAVPSRPIEFPCSEVGLADKFARRLFRMSSPLPPSLRAAAEGEGFAAPEGTRGFVFNADLVSVIRFLDIGTRVARGVR